jgi:hypothetical protein
MDAIDNIFKTQREACRQRKIRMQKEVMRQFVEKYEKAIKNRIVYLLQENERDFDEVRDILKDLPLATTIEKVDEMKNDFDKCLDRLGSSCREHPPIKIHPCPFDCEKEILQQWYDHFNANIQVHLYQDWQKQEKHDDFTCTDRYTRENVYIDIILTIVLNHGWIKKFGMNDFEPIVKK